MDLSKLSQGEKIIAGSGVALLIFSFFPWFGLDVKFAGIAAVSVSHNGWGNIFSLLAVLVGVAMVAQIGLSKFTTAKLPAPPVPWGRMHMFLGGAALALVLLTALVGDSLRGVDLDRKFGLFLGLAAAAGLAYGGFARSKEPEVTQGFRA